MEDPLQASIEVFCKAAIELSHVRMALVDMFTQKKSAFIKPNEARSEKTPPRLHCLEDSTTTTRQSSLSATLRTKTGGSDGSRTRNNQIDNLGL